MNYAERWLKILLLLFGLPAAVAVVPFVMPWSWMAAVHESLGMGVLPHKPIVDYLARYASGFSALYGFLLLLLMTDVRRYAPIITFQAVAILVMSSVGAIFAYRAGMPMWWILGDVISCWLFCGAMLWLQVRIPAAPRRVGFASEVGIRT
jgi:hypothetical protein